MSHGSVKLRPPCISLEIVALVGPLAVMVVGLGGLSVAAYVVMALLVIIWTLFAAPVWCGAINRERGRGVEYCRNNSSGLLLGVGSASKSFTC